MKRTGLHQVNLKLQIIDSNNKHHELNLTLGLDSLCSRAFQLTLSISPTTLPCAQAAALLFDSYLKFLLVHLLQAYSFITSIFIYYKHTSLSIVIKVALKSLSANCNICVILGLVSTPIFCVWVSFSFFYIVMLDFIHCEWFLVEALWASEFYFPLWPLFKKKKNHKVWTPPVMFSSSKCWLPFRFCLLLLLSGMLK